MLSHMKDVQELFLFCYWKQQRSTGTKYNLYLLQPPLFFLNFKYLTLTQITSKNPRKWMFAVPYVTIYAHFPKKQDFTQPHMFTFYKIIPTILHDFSYNLRACRDYNE